MKPSSSLLASRDLHEAGGARLSATLVPAAKIVLAALAIAIMVRTFIVEPFAIPSGSMSPGLEAGDYIFVDKMAYGWSRAGLPLGDPVSADGHKRILDKPVIAGDVIVFVGPGGQDFVKRVIGSGGDRVALVGGQVILNGAPLPCATATATQCREMLPGGQTHLVRRTEPSALADFPETVVPSDHFFVLGDNRNASADSRVARADGGVGLVSRAEILGRAQRIFFSLRDGIQWRRIGQRIE